MSGKKPTQIFKLLSFPVRLLNEKVRPANPDPEIADFSSRYLDLADKVLHNPEPRPSAPEPAEPAVTPHLRLEPADGSPPSDYRILREEVEVRVFRTAGPGEHWRPLTEQEISAHVLGNTVVARWLVAKLGWRKVLRKCQASRQTPPAA